jgi:hypothetical protein
MLSEDTVIAMIALRILVATRNDLYERQYEMPAKRLAKSEELRAFILRDNTGMWAKAEAALKAMDTP